MKVKKLNEDIDVFTSGDFDEYSNNINLDDAKKEIPTSPDIGPELGISSEIIKAINDEWNTIDMYNGLIAMMRENGFDDMVEVIQDIVLEENYHVGQLQQVLSLISSNTDGINHGAEEAEEQID